MKINSLGCFSLAFALVVTGCGRDTNQYEPPPPPEVTTANPVQQKLTLFVEANGETEAVEKSEVRARVGGFVQKIHFEPGQVVTAGQELYSIEPDTYRVAKESAAAAVEAAKAAVLVAEATLAVAQAAVEKAVSDYNREERLMKSNAGSQSELDAARAERDAALAEVGAAKANIEAEKAKQLQAESTLAQTELDLEYTTVRAPIDGRISKTQVKLGNLVEEGTTLASVVDQRKIFANFSISDRKLLELLDAKPQGEDQPDTPEEWSKLAVYLQRDPRDRRWISGRMEYADQEGIDPTTGTFGLRAEFDNSDRDLFPGMFVIIRLPIRELDDAILVPERAITRTQQGDFLMVVGAGNAVERRPVTLGQKLDGWVLVKTGLDAGESFVLDGLQRARPSTPVTPVEVPLSTEDSPILQAAAEFSPQ